MPRREVLLRFMESCEDGRHLASLHSLLLKTGVAHDRHYATKLTTYYAKSASVESARKLFDELPQRSVYLWNSVLGSYCRDRQYEQTLRLFKQMVSNGKSAEGKPDNYTVPVALKACAGLRVLEYGEMVHGYVKKSGEVDMDMFVGSALIDLYSKCGQMGSALKVFREFPSPDVVMCTSMITGLEHNGSPVEALQLFTQMAKTGGFVADPVSLITAISACTQLLYLKVGSSVHGFMYRMGFDANLSLLNSVLNLYAKTGSIRLAMNLFRKMPRTDVISWSSIIACYVCKGATNEALDLFNEMIEKGYKPNEVSVVGALQACAAGCNLEEGKKIHALASEKKIELNVSVSTAIVDMYMKCSSPDEAFDLFLRMPNKDVVAWVTLLSGCAENGMAYESMDVFRNMLASEIIPDAVAIVKILAACSELGILQQAICLHGYLIISGFGDNMYVGATLLELYSKCGSLDNAIKVFNGMCEKDVVIWSSMIAGYGIHGQGKEALRLFYQMTRNSSVQPNNVTFLSLLSACSHSGLIEEGIEMFNKMVHKYHLKPDSEHYSIVVDLLGRIGQLDKAIDVIEMMPTLAGSHVWGALLGACRIHDDIEMGELAARHLLHLDPDHAGYYVLLSNIYAMYGKWDDMSKVRSLIKEKKLKKAFGQSVIEVKNKTHTFVVDDRAHQDSWKIFELLRNLEMRMTEEAYVPNVEVQLNGTEEFC
ncbi:putative pentatricopeptide repeat-containing protein At3g01580 isoform X1 [Rhodamnia argentea]|uniref:Pentatricopeptide repeat-containing protein At3g01580 n=1 Tax=Rhodamnia argentea TaxID=178133 RepID=A0A8B8P7T3_9MYRT|nr:putative pentatricopeptide repeat-containing protein At3g01580 isoform X2 [Rhodamnia argentea]XP_048140534.1 putative pentatricopeptide repeat-containing protein At3g01580 isoform X1 [Rhodamnia argentea]XP_048140535.1 putative pentatricopeptide repeat-containing protein At3g01580 isoform X1 [Rhodamnia argentea]